MLKSLYIKNFAIIDELNVTFENGLNIVTGETGAGKTLLMKAIQLLLGGKFTVDTLRTGYHSLIIEGTFEINRKPIVIRRLYNSDKKTKSYINDEPVKYKALLEITNKLADIHGQHEHQNLLDSNSHIVYLDLFGNYNDILANIKNLYYETNSNNLELSKLILKQNEYDEKKSFT